MLLHSQHDLLRSVPLAFNISSLFLKSIPIRNKTTVMLGVILNEPKSELSPRLKLVRTIAEYAGRQLENVLLHDEAVEQAKLKTEVKLAAKIQLQLLPAVPPDIAGLEIAAHSTPASDVGGDFYDFIYQPEIPFTFVVGDVSGKGVAAALLMATARTVIRSRTKFLPPLTPEAIVDLLDGPSEV